MEIALVNWKYISGLFELFENKVGSMQDNFKKQVGDNVSLNFLPAIKNFIFGVITGGGGANQAQLNEKDINKSGAKKKSDRISKSKGKVL